MRRLVRPLPLLPLVIAAGLVTGAAPAAAQTGPCTEAAKGSMPEGEGHDHLDIAQHRLRCRLKEVAFLSLKDQLQARPDVVLGEIDVKADRAVVGVTFPESGFLLFDVADPARPRFLSWYRGSECDQTVSDVNCGAFVDLASDGQTVFLSVQSLSPVGLGRPTPGVSPVSAPGVEVVDVSNPAEPSLTQTYPVVSEGGVHTSRSHVIPGGPLGNGPRAAGEYLFSIANGVGVEITKVVRSGGRATLESYNTLVLGDVHDTFIQNDPITERTYLYVAAGFQSGFNVFDVTDPAQIQELAQWDLTPECPEDWYAHTVDVTHRGAKRYVTLPAELFDLGEQLEEDQAEGCGRVWGNGDRPGPLWIVDASELSKLGQPGDDEAALKAKSKAALVATWTNAAGRAGGALIFSPHNQQIVGDRIYLSHYHGGVVVLDASGAFAGRPERPAELGFAVPSGADTRPLYKPTLPPVSPFFSEALGWRPSIWDIFFHKGYVLAADMVGGLYVLQYEGDEPPPPGTGRGLRLRLQLRYRAGRGRDGKRCVRGPVRARVRGKRIRRIRRVDFMVGKRRVARDRKAPFAAVIKRGRLGRGRGRTVSAVVVLKSGGHQKLSRRLRACPRR